jgi:glycosyltransferase involved in cell wall biosynthesis
VDERAAAGSPAASETESLRDRNHVPMNRHTDRTRILLGIPVFNEERYLPTVLARVRRFARDILVVDDGSTDRTPALLAEHPVDVVRHQENRGYGRSMREMLRSAALDGYDWLVVMDCDEQHEPEAIPDFVEAIEEADAGTHPADVVSGSRYLADAADSDVPPADRRSINAEITAELNRRLGWRLTDAFCGFKAYRIEACRRLRLDVDGYDFPMQFWVQAASKGLAIREIPVKLIYNDPSRTFGGPLDEARTRRRIYQATLARELLRCREFLSTAALQGLGVSGRRTARFGTAILTSERRTGTTLA